jgi:hypothetical protein
MATRQGQRILLEEMVVDGYIGWHSLVCYPRGRRTIERLGAGWPLLLSSPTYLPQRATLPSSRTSFSSGSALAQIVKSRRGGAGGW